MAVEFTSNLGKVLKGADDAFPKAAEIIGGTAERYAKQICPVKTGNLRNSITHTAENNGRMVVIGSAVEYAPYVELGTGRGYEGSGGRGVIAGRKPKPYLRPAIEDHKDEYMTILEEVLRG